MGDGLGPESLAGRPDEADRDRISVEITVGSFDGPHDWRYKAQVDEGQEAEAEEDERKHLNAEDSERHEGGRTDHYPPEPVEDQREMIVEGPSGVVFHIRIVLLGEPDESGRRNPMTHGLRCAATAQARESDEPSGGTSGSGSCCCAGSVMAPLVLSLTRETRPVPDHSLRPVQRETIDVSFPNVLATVWDREMEELPDGDRHQFIDVNRKIPRTFTEVRMTVSECSGSSRVIRFDDRVASE